MLPAPVSVVAELFAPAATAAVSATTSPAVTIESVRFKVVSFSR